MDAYTLANAQKDLNNPNSPFFIGNKSSFAMLNDYIRSGGKMPLNGSGINTNYFGANKAAYLAPSTVDKVEILNKVRSDNKAKNWLLGGTLAVAGAFLLRGKIPFIGKFLKKI